MSNIIHTVKKAFLSKEAQQGYCAICGEPCQFTVYSNGDKDFDCSSAHKSNAKKNIAAYEAAMRDLGY
jgi:hypothetical protein